MKRVLILAYDFPPYISVGGLRPYNWYKYLHEFGVYPIVITRQWSNDYGNNLDYIAPSNSTNIVIEETAQGTLIKTPYFPNFANRIMLKYGDSKYKILRKAVTAYYEFVQFLFLVGTKSSLYFAAEEYLKKNNVDVIIATGDPFILFNYASKLSKAFNTPWVADYRDLWSQKISLLKSLLFKNWYLYQEKQIVNSSYLVITVSSLLEKKIKNIIKNKEFLILPNGYDPEGIEAANSINKKKDTLSIAFAGTVYDWHPIESFLSVINEFIKHNKDAKLCINFYGINITSKLKKLISNHFVDIQERIHFLPKMLNKLILKELANEDIMLLFNDYSIMGTKIYDYIGLRKTILLCYANDKDANKLKKRFYPIQEIENVSNHLQEDLIKETNSGYVIQDTKHLRTVLEQLYEEFNNRGTIRCNTINVENYSRKHQVKQLAEIIKNVSYKAKST